MVPAYPHVHLHDYLYRTELRNDVHNIIPMVNIVFSGVKCNLCVRCWTYISSGAVSMLVIYKFAYLSTFYYVPRNRCAYIADSGHIADVK